MKKNSIKKKDLIDTLASRNPDFAREDIDDVVNLVFEAMTDALTSKRRIEIRGFGNFSVHEQKEREFINPKTGNPTSCPSGLRVVFRAGKKLVKRDE